MNVKLDNFIGIYEDAFSHEYCDSVIKYYELMVEKGFSHGSGIKNHFREDKAIYAHSMSMMSLRCEGDVLSHFNSKLWADIYPKYADKFTILHDIGAHDSLAYKVQKTEIGGGYHTWHCEATTRSNAGRILAWVLYLNSVDEGGETEFLYYPIRVKPKKGTFVIFPAGFTHTHRGNPPLSNTKYVSTGWIEF